MTLEDESLFGKVGKIEHLLQAPSQKEEAFRKAISKYSPEELDLLKRAQELGLEEARRRVEELERGIDRSKEEYKKLFGGRYF